MHHIDDHFIKRLENWGRHYRPGRGSAGTSITAIVCERMADAAGRRPKDDYREVRPRPEIDEADAQIIEWCWSRAAYRMDAAHRALLKAHFVMSHDKRMTCRVLNIIPRNYDSALDKSVRLFQQSVAIFEGFGDNITSTTRQPAQRAE